MHDDVIHRRERRVSLRIERDPQIVGAESVRPFVDQEVRAVGGGEDDVRADKRPRTEIEPVPIDLQLEHADARVPVRRVVRSADHRPDRRDEQGGERCGCRSKCRGAAYRPHLPSSSSGLWPTLRLVESENKRWATPYPGTDSWKWLNRSRQPSVPRHAPSVAFESFQAQIALGRRRRRWRGRFAHVGGPSIPPCPSCDNGVWTTVAGGDSTQDPYPGS